MKLRLGYLCVLGAVTAFVTGCSGAGSTTTSPTPTPVPAKNAAVVATTIIVTNLMAQTVDSYAANANGTTSPSSSFNDNALALAETPGIRSYFGLNTTPLATVQSLGLIDALAYQFQLPDEGSAAANQIRTMTVDANSNLYVATSDTIYVFKGAAPGTPTQTINGALTGLGTNGVPAQMVADGKGDLYVAKGLGYAGSQVVMFAPGATGNVAPTVITSASYYPTGVALDAAGNIYIDQGSLYSPSGIGLGTAAVYEFAAGSTAGTSPIRTITGPATGLPIYTANIQVDAGGNIFVLATLNGQADFLVYGATASGNVAPASTIVRTTGSSTDSQFLLY